MSNINNYQAIINLESLAEISFDEGDFETHMSLWGDSFKFESPFGNFDQPEAYLDWLKGFYNMVNSQGGTRHFLINPVVHITEDKATYKAYLYVINRSNGTFMGSSVVEDKLTKAKDGWKFTYRSVAPDQDLSSNN